MQLHKEKTLTCDEKFFHRKALEDHMNIKHTGKLDFVCEDCDKRFPKRFPTSGYLRSHQKSHTDLKPFICKGCGKGFRTKKDADRHFIAIHTDIRPLKWIYEGCTKNLLWLQERIFMNEHIQEINLISVPSVRRPFTEALLWISTWRFTPGNIWMEMQTLILIVIYSILYINISTNILQFLNIY